MTFRFLRLWAGLLGTMASGLAAEDARPVVEASRIREESPVNPALPTLFLVGDSTVKSGGQGGAYGWGERLAPYFDPARINVVNHAIGGRSSRTFLTEGRWARTLAQVRAGDFIIVQFGHNDGGRIGDPAAKGRPSGRGTGPETVEDTRRDGTREQVHTFGWYLARYVEEGRAKGATVILASPVPHRDRWETGRDFADHAAWAAEVARKGGALYFDLTLVVSAAYRRVGAEQVGTFFADRATHTNDAGARFNAACVVTGLRSLPGDPLGSYLARQAPAAP